MKTKVTVTAEHIKQGKQKDSQHCAVSCAMRELVREGWLIGAGYCGFFAFPNSPPSSVFPFAEHIEFDVEEYVKRWMSDFDNGKPVEPFEFYVFLPEMILK